MSDRKVAAPAASLYVVATPIGNLGDMVPRAVEILQTVSLILAEDTRHSKKLLQHFDIRTPVRAFHDHSDPLEVDNLIVRLRAGESLALISDAGTPLVSDPGYPLVKRAHDGGIPVVPVPGACAAIAALSASGLPADHFWFEGFLPARSAARQQRLQELSALPGTLMFYEAPHRILELLVDMCEVYGPERRACLGRELTKQFETVRSDTLGALRLFVEGDANQQRGECVVLVAPLPRRADASLDEESERVLAVLLEELSVKQASALAAKITGKPKRALYDAALRKKAED